MSNLPKPRPRGIAGYRVRASRSRYAPGFWFGAVVRPGSTLPTFYAHDFGTHLDALKWAEELRRMLIDLDVSEQRMKAA